MMTKVGYGIALLLSTTLAFFSAEIASLIKTDEDLRDPLADVVSVKGLAWLNSPIKSTRSQILPDTPIYDLDQIQTSSRSEIEIRFADEGSLVVSGKARLGFEQARHSGQFVIVNLIEGDFKVLEIPSPKSVRVFRDGQLLYLAQKKPTQRVTSTPKSTPKPKIAPMVAKKKLTPLTTPKKKKLIPNSTPVGYRAKITNSNIRTRKLPPKNRRSISNTHIRQVMASQKKLFDRCYAGYLKKNLKTEGEVQVFFEITTQGRVTKSRIQKANIGDRTFRKCITQSVARARFKPFDGVHKRVIFPIRFGVK